jgi:hypothetical protein
MKHFGHSLAAIVEQSQQLKQVRKADLHFGDWVIVQTLNSVYRIRVLEEGFYLVSGGWFDQQGISPLKTTIAGCTWAAASSKWISSRRAA